MADVVSVSNPSTPISHATPVSTIHVPETSITLEPIIPPSAHVSSTIADSSETTSPILPMMKNQLNRGAGSQFTFSLDTPSLSSGTLDKYLKNVLGHDSMNTLPDLLKHPNIEPSLTPQQQTFTAEKPLLDTKDSSSLEHSKSKEPESDEESAGSSPSNQLATTSEGKSGEVIPIPRGKILFVHRS